MTIPKQLPLFADIQGDDFQTVSSKLDSAGTFKESMQAPIHSWFKYPAGYSYRFVDDLLSQFRIAPTDWVYDMFSGTGTTLVTAKQRNINGYGVEAHPFVHWVADVKLFWDYERIAFGQELTQILHECRIHIHRHIEDTEIEYKFPELIYKCYHPHTLRELYLLRGYILQQVIDIRTQDFLKLALTDTLRTAAAAGTGWPYIAPRKNTGDKPAKPAMTLFEKTVWKMYNDLIGVLSHQYTSTIHNVLGDARLRQTGLADEQVSLAITSPPYLNNYDYADRTRLEMYFWGIVRSWKDITEQIRDRLMVAATTQVVRKRYAVDTVLATKIRDVSPEVYQTIQHAVLQLASTRLTKGGKKDYDLMVALYFNDLLPVLQETYRVLKPGGSLCMVLGDSAPYGIHIPTETLIGQLGVGVGFKHFEYLEFRTRGNKWKANPQRHSIQLREGLVTLTK